MLLQLVLTAVVPQWLFALPAPGQQESSFALQFEPVPDEGALSARALRARRAKEQRALASFENGDIRALRALAPLHRWLHTRHAAYAYPGALEKRGINASDSLAASY